jgi:aldehyde oxidoreductase
MTTVRFDLNGRPVEYDGDLERSLLSWLRDDGHALSVKDGCSAQAYCWSCAVEIDGKAKLSCSTPMKKLDGATITTLEGWPERVRSIIGEAYVQRGAVQCGFCTPGFLTSTRVLLESNPNPTRDDVVKALRRHRCRCTGYEAIIDAVLDAAAALRDGTTPGLTPANGIGESHPKYDAYQKAIGNSPFVDDLRFDGMLHGVVRLSDHPRATVLSIDTDAAAAMPGVVAVLTGDDVPGKRYQGLILKDWPLMVTPGETTRYIGDVLAVVVADTETQARAAVDAIVIQYDELEPLTDPELSLTSDIHVHDGGNLVAKSQVQRGGNAEDILAASAHVTRGTYTTQRVEHAYMEVEACVAMPDGDNIRVHSQSQGVYEDRRQIASILGLPVEQVVVTHWASGGAFGGKEDLSIQGHAALAAFKLGRPVKVKLDRVESLRMHPKRHPVRMTYAVGCDADGKLTAIHARILGDTGAYASVGGKVLERCAGHCTAAYSVPCVDVIAEAVSTNNLPCGAMRGFGANQVTFAFERCLDELCAMGEFDPWQFRMDNALTEGSPTATGQILDGGVGVRATLEAVKSTYDNALESGRAVGLACGIKNCGVGNGMSDWCEVKIEITGTGRVIVHHGWTEMGQGIHTVVQQILTEETGISPELVDVITSTDSEAESGMTTASRGTSLVGNAMLVATKNLNADLEHNSLDDLKGRTYSGRWSFDKTTKPGAPGEIITHYSYSYATQLVIMNEKGRIERVVAAHDAGRIMNPALFRGQIVGSIHMGLGYALSESLPQVNGHLVSTKMRDLGIMPMHDMPDVEVIGVEVSDPLGPYGAKGVGEVGLVPTAGAVANALTAFDGVSRHALPMNLPEVTS